ncbi:hypothetical protein PSTG_03722 [Puccinia striiformis f. sp. tritici PST-78]|uniref:Uncharacterized protein n=1 Tax=Puccinia striiformis f. sp. tritici PST-78 TaxID=1165861 RepID=A0A0L0VVB5_9BASI|nr:hypothetical protein PSTG_03722 [Puccinia striiformis f. sp. tritici PST-78]
MEIHALSAYGEGVVGVKSAWRVSRPLEENFAKLERLQAVRIASRRTGEDPDELEPLQFVRKLFRQAGASPLFRQAGAYPLRRQAIPTSWSFSSLLGIPSNGLEPLQLVGYTFRWPGATPAC